MFHGLWKGGLVGSKGSSVLRLKIPATLPRTEVEISFTVRNQAGLTICVSTIGVSGANGFSTVIRNCRRPVAWHNEHRMSKGRAQPASSLVSVPHHAAIAEWCAGRRTDSRTWPDARTIDDWGLPRQPRPNSTPCQKPLLVETSKFARMANFLRISRVMRGLARP